MSLELDMYESLANVSKYEKRISHQSNLYTNKVKIYTGMLYICAHLFIGILEFLPDVSNHPDWPEKSTIKR